MHMSIFITLCCSWWVVFVGGVVCVLVFVLLVLLVVVTFAIDCVVWFGFVLMLCCLYSV